MKNNTLFGINAHKAMGKHAIGVLKIIAPNKEFAIRESDFKRHVTANKHRNERPITNDFLLHFRRKGCVFGQFLMAKNNPVHQMLRTIFPHYFAVNEPHLRLMSIGKHLF